MGSFTKQKTTKWHPSLSTLKSKDDQVGMTGNHVTPLTYTRSIVEGVHTTCSFFSSPYPMGADNGSLLARWTNCKSPSDSVVNAAYARLVNKVKGDQSELGAAALEWQKQMTTIERRAVSMRRSWENFRKGKFFKRLLRRARYHGSSDFANNWLEFWFGWYAPIADIYNATQIIERPLPTANVQGSKSSRYNYYYAGGGYQYTFSGHQTCKMGAKIDLENPNLFLGNQLGLVNPAAIVWEAVPFSFLVDWVVNVGDWLNSFTDFVGLSSRHEYTTRYTKGDLLVRNSYYPGKFTIFRTLYMTRGQGITKPTLDFNGLSLGVSAKRASYAVALLRQQLGRFT